MSNADQTPKDQFLVSRNFVRDSFQEPFTLITTPDFIDSLLVFWTLAIAQTRAGVLKNVLYRGGFVPRSNPVPSLYNNFVRKGTSFV